MDDLQLIYPPITDYYTQAEVNNLVASAVPTGALTTISGDIITYVDSRDNWLHSHLDQTISTVSGNIITQIPSLAGYATQSWANSTFYTQTQTNTISGNIINQIPSLAGYATQTWVTGQGYTVSSGGSLSGINGIQTTLSGGVWYVTPSGLLASQVGYIPPSGVLIPDGSTNTSTTYATSVMTSNTTPSPYVTSSTSEFSSTYAAWKAFNQTCLAESDSWVTNALPSANSPQSIMFNFGSGNSICINKYALQARPWGGEDFPKTWKFQGTNDAAAAAGDAEPANGWVTLDERTNVSDPGSSNWSPYFTFTNGTSYQKYRLRITDRTGGNGYVAIAEIKLVAAQHAGAWAGPSINTVYDALTWIDPIVYNYTQVSGSYATQIWANSCFVTSSAVATSIAGITASGVAYSPSYALTPDGSQNDSVVYATSVMISDSAPSPYAVTDSSIYTAGYEGYKAFNQDGASSMWHSSGAGMPQWIQFDFGVGTGAIINKYAVQAGNHPPSAWTLQGSNGSAYTTLHTVASSGLTTNAWSSYYTFINSTRYRYYRLYITTSDGSYVSVDEIRLVAASYTTSWYSGNPITTVCGLLDWAGPVVANYTQVSGNLVTGSGVFNGATGASITHGLNTANHITVVSPTSQMTAFGYWTTKGLNSDTVYATVGETGTFDWLARK